MYERLKRFLPEARLFTQERMARHTTFKIGGSADLYAQPETLRELQDILACCRESGAPFTLLGGGSNVLISDEGVRGVVAQTRPGLHQREINGNRITAQAGVTLADLAETARKAGLSGLAFAAGIPGTVGGAVYMNAGAYDHAIADVCESVELITPEGDAVTLTAAEMRFGYRHSAAQENGGLIVSATFVLAPGDPAAIRAETLALNERRAKSQPLDRPSAGSTFKRPQGYFAGKLIADCGLKGYRVGGAQVSEKHAGFIINAGDATAADVRSLIAHIQQTVHTAYGVWLEPEIRFLG